MDNHVVYFFVGKVSQDNERLSRWPQWQQCLPRFDELFAPYVKTARIQSYQVFKIPLSTPGHVTLKKVPRLTALKWNLDDHRRWADHATATASPYEVEHVETTVVSSKGEETPDVCLFLDDTIPAGIDGLLFNQCFTLSVRERVHAAMPPGYWDSTILRLRELLHAVRVGRALRPWVITAKDSGQPVRNLASSANSSLVFPHFAKRPVGRSLEFSEFFQTWTYIE
jgi:hypothetical protein